MPPRPFIRGRGNVIPRLARTAAVPPKGTRVRFNPAGSMAKPGCGCAGWPGFKPDARAAKSGRGRFSGGGRTPRVVISGLQ